MKHSNYLLFLIISLFFSCKQETIQLKKIFDIQERYKKLQLELEETEQEKKELVMKSIESEQEL